MVVSVCDVRPGVTDCALSPAHVLFGRSVVISPPPRPRVGILLCFVLCSAFGARDVGPGDGTGATSVLRPRGGGRCQAVGGRGERTPLVAGVSQRLYRRRNRVRGWSFEGIVDGRGCGARLCVLDAVFCSGRVACSEGCSGM